MQSAHEAAGAAGTRHSPRPPRGREIQHSSGASRREVKIVCLKLEQRHCERSEAIHSFLLLFGLLRFARNDGLRTPCDLAV
jgi:hypothetical protein